MSTSLIDRALTAFAAVALLGCARAPAPPVQYGGSSVSLAQLHAEAMAAARRHPIAQPRVRPLYPEQAPPALTPGTTLPPSIYETRRAASLAQRPVEPSVTERVVYAPARPYYAERWRYRSPYWAYPRWSPYGYGYGYSYGYGHHSHYHPRVHLGYDYHLSTPWSLRGHAHREVPRWGGSSRHEHGGSWGRGARNHSHSRRGRY